MEIIKNPEDQAFEEIYRFDRGCEVLLWKDGQGYHYNRAWRADN